MNTVRTAPDKDTGFIRVNLNLLDSLMGLAGELVLCRNQLMQGIRSANSRMAELSSQRIDLITSEIQEAIMKTRMQSLDSVISRFSRVVRDLSMEQDKSIDFVIENQNVEIEKTILEAISTPLHQLVSRAVRVNIEPPDERAAYGKQRTGTVTLKAFSDTGQVNIIISDDGYGDELDRLDDHIVSAVEHLGGITQMESEPGKGTIVQIRLPLTLAIIPSQIIGAGSERYAIPQANLKELIRIPLADAKERIERVGDTAVIRLRGELLPLLNLSDLLGIQAACEDRDTGKMLPDRRQNIADRRSRQFDMVAGKLEERKTKPGKCVRKRTGNDRRQSSGKAIHVAVVSAGTYRYGLVVNQFYDSEEIVVKPVGRHVEQCRAFSGATIMGDGSVALILNILNLAQMGELSSARYVESTPADADRSGDALEQVITFRNHETEYFIAPLEPVERIERIDTSAIEIIGDRRVIQYRGGALPLYDISQFIDLQPLPLRDVQDVIVFSLNGKEIGLMATPPFDTVETVLDIDTRTFTSSSVKGSMIIQGHTALFLDIEKMIEKNI